jgi:hypothetical protein
MCSRMSQEKELARLAQLTRSYGPRRKLEKCLGGRLLFHVWQLHYLKLSKPIPVAVRSKVWVCGRSITGIAGSNPAGCRDVICGLLGDYTASCGNYLPTLRDNVSVPSSRVEIQEGKVMFVLCLLYKD